MATSTLAAACPADDWTEVVDGAAYASFGLQIAHTNAAQVAIATAEPAANSDNFVVLSATGDRSVGPLDLTTTDKVYVKGLKRDSKVRLYRVSV